MVTVVYVARESPVDFLGAAVTPRFSEFTEGTNTLLGMLEGLRVFRNPDCFVALQYLPDFAFPCLRFAS